MSQDAKYNSHSKINCVIACLQAEQAGADEGLMVAPYGFVNPTNACNFFTILKMFFTFYSEMRKINSGLCIILLECYRMSKHSSGATVTF